MLQGHHRVEIKASSQTILFHTKLKKNGIHLEEILNLVKNEKFSCFPL